MKFKNCVLNKYCKRCQFLWLLFLTIHSFTFAQRQSIEAKNGILDLSKYNFEEKGTVVLKGEWEFYWQKYLRGIDFTLQTPSGLVNVPDSWNNYEIEQGKKLQTQGYATYRLRIKVPSQYKQNELLGIKVGFIATNYALYVQNKLLNRARDLGKDASNTKGYYNPDVYYFVPQRDTVEIVMHIANFADRLSGLTQTLTLGKAEQIRKDYESSLMIDFFLLGILVIMGCYHVSLYIFRQKVKATIWFALYCFLIAIRILVTDNYYLTDLFPDIHFEVGNKLSYLTFYLGVPLLAVFVHSLYKEDFSTYVVKFYLLLGSIFSLVVLFTDGFFYSTWLVYFQLAALLIIVYSIYFVVRILVKNRENSKTFALGLFTIFCTATNDILFSNLIINTANLMPWGLFVFIFSQTLILSKRFSNAFNRVEELSEQLQKANAALETKVEARTQQLKEANEELAQNFEELKANLELINQQNKEIKAQHFSITSSINYAKTIQQSVLPNFDNIQTHFSDSFLIFKPKDIVSGDFYYFNQKGNKIFLAAADCTGHGVPGAFMSLIGYKTLNAIIEVHQITEPAHILKSLDIGIRQVLRQGEDSKSRDGMDIALVVIEKEQKQIKFAGAKNPLVYMLNGQMEVVSGDKYSIGGSENSSFNQTTVHFSEKDNFSFYLFSDGYQDQFGGEANKKLMKRHFRELLFQIKGLSMQEQGNLLQEWHEAWKGNLAQTDDILVMGFRL
ncbi:7TM diverse intracellular signaling domain-containing protein [Thermoflexibacter ruber]|uniref:Serine phosphatase RsbU, regulator of sigma subunit n=1 Tax=Thermoflexibacter ruber TaxID=1003 RepID=A0A1I2IID7_9BACT|nr:7TM diverse intracellular signaling domain-containing protein [Thermoflexibacter ruber]SFF41423.1 Serine phosphatase RsbU, regulator of sigma subunit [Thermoflexibacter ruber]